MKKIISLSGLLMCINLCYAQTGSFQYDTRADVYFTYPPRGTGGRAIVHDLDNVLTLNYEGDFTGGSRIGKTLFVSNNYQVGIGTSIPTEALHIENGSLLVKKNLVGDIGAQLTLTNEFGNMNGAVRLNLNNGGAISWIKGIVTGTNVSTGSAIAFGVPSSASEGTEVMRITGNGFVGIGTTAPKEKLSVNGNIRAQQVKVEMANWPDYVFEETYKLPSLKETEAFIKENKHLPGVPKAKEIGEDGLSLGEMNKILMQKVEELTLHMIHLDKENEELKLQIKLILDLQADVKKLKEMTDN